MGIRVWILQKVCGLLTGHAGYVERDPSGNINHKCSACGKWATIYTIPVKIPINVAVERFDWLKDYGPHWEPGALAFWLEPDTADQLASWYAKYRPGDYGVKEVGALKVELLPPLQRELFPSPQAYAQYANQLQMMNAAQQNAFNQAMLNHQMAANQYTNMQQNNLSQFGLGQLLGGLYK